MKISTLLARERITFSCEIFPPKRQEQLQNTVGVVQAIAALPPDFISVTYGAGGGTRENTVYLAEEVQRRGVTALAHLTCVTATRQSVDATLDALRAGGIENVLALRGDLPAGMDASALSKEFRHAADLVRAVRARGSFCIGAACYPEGHPEAPGRDADIAFLKEKVDAGCDFLTTQMFFDNDVLYRFLYRALAKGINVPVVAGVMPVTNIRQVARIRQLADTSFPPRFRAMADRFGRDPASMRQAGIAYATEQMIDLLSNGVRAVHVYTMNQPDVAAQIYANLSDILR